jgi:hypothetical protein
MGSRERESKRFFFFPSLIVVLDDNFGELM